jgi:hypothetical protein
MSILKKIFAATALYGQGFKPTDTRDRYSIKVYVGGFAGPKTAEERVNQEIGIFCNENGYKSYEIIYRGYNLIPSYFEYIVQYSR